METFTRVVEAGSFKKAAETLRVLPSTVTKTVKDLEAYLGGQLLNRTTRALSITDAGLRYYDSCKAILREIQAAEGTVTTQTGVVRGAIKVGTTPSLARHFIIPALPRFTARYPDIEIDLRLGDTVIDLIQEGIDCVIRAGQPRPSTLIVRRLGAFRWYVCGSPLYLANHGEPVSMAELREHVAVGYASSVGRSPSWTFLQGEELHSISMKEHVSVDETDAYVAAGVAGLGLIRAASYMVREPLSDGRLKRILSSLEAPTEPISALYPQSRHLSPAIRAFIDWCVEVVGGEAKSW
jgi:LysR family transcriptional regulator, regulator for bpeEF and oprC